MGYRLAQLTLLVLALAFAFTALAVFTEPWQLMEEANVLEAVCAHTLAAALAWFCFRAALHFGTLAAYGDGKRIREPEL